MAQVRLKAPRGATFRKLWTEYTTAKVVHPIQLVARGFPTILTATGHGLPLNPCPVSLMSLGELSTKDPDLQPSFDPKYRIPATRLDDDRFSIDVDSSAMRDFKAGGYVVYSPPKDFTGYTARAHFRANVDDPDPPLLSLNHLDGIALGGTEGSVEMILTEPRTAALPEDFSYWNIELIAPGYGGDVARFKEGTLELSPDVTHGPGVVLPPNAPTGPPGPPGPPGPLGPTGPASSTMVFFYTADANATGPADPGTGKLRWNNADQNAATLLIVDWLTADGFDPTQLFLHAAIDSTIQIQDKDFALQWRKWRITAPAENLADFFVVPVELVDASSPTLQFQHNKQIAVILQLLMPTP